MQFPYGSTLNDPAVQAAFQSLAQTPAPQDSGQASTFHGASNLNDPAVQSAYQALAGVQPPQGIAPASQFNGDSFLNDPGVQSAYNNLAQIQPPQDIGQASQFNGDSTLNNPAVQAAYQALASVQAPQAAGSVPAFNGEGAMNDASVQSAYNDIAGNKESSQLPFSVCEIKNALNGGEISPEMLARYDQPRYQLGSEKLLNMIPLPTGGLTKRPPLRFVTGTGWRKAKARLIPFSYSSDYKYMLLFLADATHSSVSILDRDGTSCQWEVVSMPYTQKELADISWTQCGKNIYLAHQKFPPAKLVWDGSSFTYEVIDFSNKTPIPAAPDGWYSGESDAARSVKSYVVTAINDETGEESYPSEPYEPEVSPLNESFFVYFDIAPVDGCSEYRVYKKRGGEYGYIGRCTDGNLNFEDKGYEPDVGDPPPHEQEFFKEEGDYPAIVFLHQQRLGWASTVNDPLTIWMSQTSNFECLASKSPPQDDDAIEVTLASTQANRILWAVSDRSGLAIGTSGEEWYLTGASGEGAAVTPNSLSFMPQTSYGSQPGLPPVRANSSLLFAQRGGRIARDLGYSYQSDRYEAQDLTVLAKHIFKYAVISDWCWQASPSNILWCVTDNGNLAGLTYMPEQEVIAWHRHETCGEFIGCATLDDSNGKSRLWVVVERQEGAHVEMLDPVFEGSPGTWDGDREWTLPAHLDGMGQYAFAAHCVPCLPEINMQAGSTALRVRKINAIKARVINSMPFKCRVYSQNAENTKLLDVPVKSLSSNDRLSKRNYADIADWHCPIGAGLREGAKLELVFDGPAPVTLLGLSITVEVSQEAGGQI